MYTNFSHLYCAIVVVSVENPSRVISIHMSEIAPIGISVAIILKTSWYSGPYLTHLWILWSSREQNPHLSLLIRQIVGSGKLQLALTFSIPVSAHF